MAASSLIVKIFKPLKEAGGRFDQNTQYKLNCANTHKYMVYSIAEACGYKRYGDSAPTIHPRMGVAITAASDGAVILYLRACQLYFVMTPQQYPAALVAIERCIDTWNRENPGRALTRIQVSQMAIHGPITRFTFVHVRLDEFGGNFDYGLFVRRFGELRRRAEDVYARATTYHGVLAMWPVVVDTCQHIHEFRVALTDTNTLIGILTFLDTWAAKQMPRPIWTVGLTQPLAPPSADTKEDPDPPVKIARAPISYADKFTLWAQANPPRVGMHLTGYRDTYRKASPTGSMMSCVDVEDHLARFGVVAEGFKVSALPVVRGQPSLRQYA